MDDNKVILKCIIVGFIILTEGIKKFLSPEIAAGFSIQNLLNLQIVDYDNL
jgi:hypothetical protein